MTQREFQKALDLLEPGVQVERRAAAAVEAGRRPRPRLIRPALAAAAVLLVMCTMGTALAASPELRQAVLIFFHLEEPERIPPQEPGQDSAVAQGGVGGLVTAEYIRLDERYRVQCGLFSQVEWDETYTSIRSAQFWEMEDGGLVPVDVELHATSFEAAWRGTDYQGTFYWFVHDGQLGLYAGESRAFDGEMETSWYLSDLPGRTDAVVLRLAQGRQLDYSEYELLCHLDTGGLEDLLAGTGAEELELAYDYTWSEDLRRVLIHCRTGLDSSRAYLCDRAAGTVTPLDQLAGMEVHNAAFGAGDTLILYSLHWDGGLDCQTVACYAYDVSSGRLTETLARSPFCREWEASPSGVMTFGQRCVRISEEGRTWVVDLNTGEETPVEGFAFTQDSSFMPSPDGERLLYIHTTSPETGGLGISQLGVMDLERGTFLAFDREGYEAFYEESVGWYDDSRVAVSAHAVDGGARYIIFYQL